MILASTPAEKIEAERIAAQIKAFGGKVEPIRRARRWRLAAEGFGILEQGGHGRFSCQA
ncbi:MAG: hypothetical protein KL839_16335 [Rhizobium sp.]|nr:hypothetical protein [Rhizobium sp.]